MKKIALLVAFYILPFILFSQPIDQKLQKAYQQFESDSQLKHATISLYVINAKTGEVEFDKNSQIGLAPASTQKIITAVTAFELLGKNYRYETKFGYYSSIKKGNLDGGLYFKPVGDPTLGSWRWPSTTENAVMDRLLSAMKKAGIDSFHSSILDLRGWKRENIPGGWIWDDIGNYYGAGAGIINWRENQFDLILKSGPTIKDAVTVINTKPNLYGIYFASYVTAAAKGTGDNCYIYLPIAGNIGDVTGTIPVDEEQFTVSGAIPSPIGQFLSTLHDSLSKRGFTQQWNTIQTDNYSKVKIPSPITFFHTERSPSLDSIIYWFLQKSINLYGEALIKTFGYEKKGVAATDTGVAIVKNFWKQKGLDENELNIYDGSGLSPLNRVTTHAQVEVLKYAKQQAWFSYFFNALPEYNNMKMKSGTISDVKGFCGYHTSSDGTQYIFSLLVNNYNGPSSALVNKMYKVLDVLK
jgi:D-alanyl-D-alanine carboxypeptidase/D-alanyl-D-alanine-endopeptidase (penicillin-binding protein 4)